MHATAVRRLTGDEHLDHEFAKNWQQYELDEPTCSLLTYAEKLTKTPNLIEDKDIEALKIAGFNDETIYEVTALVGFYNFTGRMEAAAGLSFDFIPETAKFAESKN